MVTIERRVVKQLPPLAVENGPDPSDPTLLLSAVKVMPHIYAQHFKLRGVQGKMRVSCYHPTFVTVTEGDNERPAVGAIIGPKGMVPVVTILLFVDRAEALVLEKTKPWLDAIGENALPPAESEIDLDKDRRGAF